MIFDRAAKTYDEYAVLQHQIIDNLIDRLQFVKFDPKLIIDLGSGTSRAGQLLQRKYKKTKIINLDFSEKILMSKIIIYTDGGCRGNPGTGGWGVWLRYGDHDKKVLLLVVGAHYFML